MTKTSPRSVADTVARLLELLGSKGVKVFAVIDQQAEARAVGLDLRETTLVIFGNPAAGTGVMDGRAPGRPRPPAQGARLGRARPGHPSATPRRPRWPPATGSALSPPAALEVVHGLTDALVAA